MFLLNQEQALGKDQILKVTALLYLKEALEAQSMKLANELVDTAKDLGIDPGSISSLIAEHLYRDGPGRQKVNRLSSYKEDQWYAYMPTCKKDSLL